MGFSCGIVGLPNVGKSTLFNVLTNNSVAAENFPFCTIDPNVAKVPVPDERLTFLATVNHSEKTTPTTLEFVDIAGLVKGASKGEGLGNQFLSHVRSVDTICHIVRCFQSDNVVHVDGRVDPQRDFETILTELALADLEILQRKQDKLSKVAKSGDKKAKEELLCVQQAMEGLSSHQQLPQVGRPETQEFYRRWGLLLAKPMLVVCNGNPDTDGSVLAPFLTFLKNHRFPVLVMDIALEFDAKELNEVERQALFSEMGYDRDALARFITQGYQLLGLITFFTSGPKETRAWTVEQGTVARISAGKIHSDIERGFICAETYSVDDLKQHGTEKTLKEKGKIRLEGRDYIVKDGDVVYFRFNV